MLADDQVQLILKLRICDDSCITRESALDILLKNINHLSENLIETYVKLVIDRTHVDKNETVRKKLMQILS